MFDFDASLHAAEFAVFGDKAVFHLPTGAVELDVVLRDRSDVEALGKSTALSDHSLLIDILNSDIAAYQITVRQTVTVRGTDYQLIKANPDESADGITVFDIRKYRT